MNQNAMNLRLNANAVISNEQGKVLVLELKKGPFKGGLSIPGGGINPGELSSQAIRREILEETRIDVSGPIKPFGFCELVHKGFNSHRVVLLLEGKGTGVPFETEEGIPQWADVFSPEISGRLISFAKESIRIWKEGKSHFILVEG